MYLFNNSIKITVSRSNEIYISALMYFKKQIPSTNVYDFISNINSGSFYYFCKVSWDYLIRGNLDVELVVDLICKLCNKHNSINMAPNTLLQIFRGIIKLYCRDASTSMNDENIYNDGTKDKIRDVVTTASVHKIISNYIHVAPPGKIYDIQNDLTKVLNFKEEYPNLIVLIKAMFEADFKENICNINLLEKELKNLKCQAPSEDLFVNNIQDKLILSLNELQCEKYAKIYLKNR